MIERYGTFVFRVDRTDRELMKSFGKGVKSFKEGINGIEEDINAGPEKGSAKEGAKKQ